MSDFTVKDSGERKEYDSGMQRDTEKGKVDYTYALKGPMHKRWNVHLMKGAEKYDRDNWMLGNSEEELERALRSAYRHMIQWLDGDTDEDHAAAVFFNVNAAEYFKGLIPADVPTEVVVAAARDLAESVKAYKGCACNPEEKVHAPQPHYPLAEDGNLT